MPLHIGFCLCLFQLLLQSFTPLLFVAALAAVLSTLLASRAAKALTEPLNRIDFIHPDERDVDEELKPLVRRLAEQNRQILSQMEDLGREHDRQDRLRREFTANVSHELKTPLTSISGIAEIMQSGMVKPEDIQSFAGDIYQEAQRLIALVEDIIRLSRLDEGAESLEREPVNLLSVAQDVARRLDSAAQKAGVTLKVMGLSVEVRGIPSVLDEMVYNLCDNAIKYNHPGGTVNVTVAPADDGSAEVTVEDTGIGIPVEDQSRVFERFYRVDKSHSKQSGGTGLGLSIVKHAVASHKGTITLESQEEQGTTVTVKFP